jgi:hypothetical protein
VTGAVVAELLAGLYRDAILNVAQANEPAQRVYPDSASTNTAATSKGWPARSPGEDVRIGGTIAR